MNAPGFAWTGLRGTSPASSGSWGEQNGPSDQGSEPQSSTITTTAVGLLGLLSGPSPLSTGGVVVVLGWSPQMQAGPTLNPWQLTGPTLSSWQPIGPTLGLWHPTGPTLGLWQATGLHGSSANTPNQAASGSFPCTTNQAASGSFACTTIQAASGGLNYANQAASGSLVYTAIQTVSGELNYTNQAAFGGSANTANQTASASFSIRVEVPVRTADDAPKAISNDDLSRALRAARDRGRALVAELIHGKDMLTTEEFGKLLRVTRDTVNKKRQRREILALEGAREGPRFPKWQIGKDGKPFGALPQLFDRLGGDPWTVYRFLVQHHPELNGLTGVEALQRGQTDRVLDAAESTLTAAS